MAFSPRVIALLGFGEAGSAIARGLCAAGGWRGEAKPGDNAPRRVIAIDTALDQDARGTALGTEARRLDVAIERTYTEALSEADLVICAVQGEHALEAATSAAPLLKKGARYLDLCTVTGKMSDEDRAAIESGRGHYIDVAVMGGFFSQGIKAPMLVAGEGADETVDWMNANGFEAKLLGPKRGFIAMLLQTHVVHAHRRWEEMGLVAQTLRETGVDPLMTEAIERSHRRTVDAAIAPPDGRVPSLDDALELLSAKVIRGV